MVVESSLAVVIIGDNYLLYSTWRKPPPNPIFLTIASSTNQTLAVAINSKQTGSIKCDDDDDDDDDVDDDGDDDGDYDDDDDEDNSNDDDDDTDNNYDDDDDDDEK